MIKKLLSGLLSLTTCSSMFIIGDNVNLSPKKETAIIQKETDYEITATNSLAEYLSELSNSEEILLPEEQQANNFAILSFDYNADTKTIELISTQDYNCVAVITFVDDISKETVFSKEINLSAGKEMLTEQNIDNVTLPEYYYVKAELKSGFGLSLSRISYVNKYTKEMQEILAANIHDFNEEQVINFDENENTNFIVLNEETKKAESSEEYNTLVSADYENNTFVFSNADDTVASLAKDDFFYIQPTEDDIIAISVDSVEIKDNQTIIKGNENDIDDMFDFIKFESVADTSDAIINESEDDVSCTYVENEQFETGAFVFDSKELANKMVSFSKGTEYSTDFEIGDLTISPKASIGFNLEFNYYKKWTYVEIGFKLEVPIEVGLKVSAEADAADLLEDLEPIDLTKITIPTGVAGVNVEIVPSFCVELSGELEVLFTATPTLGFNYNTDTGAEPIENSLFDENALQFKISGEAFVGFQLTPQCVIINEKIASFGIPVKVGFSFNGEVDNTKKLKGLEKFSDAEFNSCIFKCKDSSEETVHACDTCINGSVNFIFEAKAELKVLIFKKEITIAGLSIPLKKWYLSIDNDDLLNAAVFPSNWLSNAKNTTFGFGTCPNIAYRTTFKVYNFNDNTYLKNAKVTVDGISETTDQNGNAAIYLKNGYNYQYTVSVDDVVVKRGNFTINNAAKNIEVDIPLNENGTVDTKNIKSNDTNGKEIIIVKPELGIYESSETTQGITSNNTIIESVRLGEHITGVLYSNGYLSIYGYGEMYDFTGNPFKNSKMVKEVCFEFVDFKYQEDNEVNTEDDSANDTETDTFFITDIGDHLFDNCTSLENINYILYDKETKKEELYSNEKTGININIPPSVTTIGDNAFANCDALTEITIPGTVKTLGDYAFSGCDRLEKAVISDGVEEIGNGAFSGCSSLIDLTLPFAHGGTVESPFRLWYLFGGQNSNVPLIEKITVTGGDIIPNQAFMSLSNLKEVVLPDSTTTINDMAFYDCNNLTKINIPDSVVSIEKNAFSGCNSIESINDDIQLVNKNGVLIIPPSVTTIGDNAFANCDALTEITIPGTVKTLGDYAFSGCDRLEKAVISDGVEEIGNGAFSGCSSLIDLTLPFAHGGTVESPFRLWYLFGGQNSNVPLIEKITVTGGNIIPNQAFMSLSNLKEVVLPDSTTTINDMAFYNCNNLTKINIPDSVTSIGDNVFINCENATIYGNKDSYAEKYASENSITFIDISSLIVYGDANCDGVVDISDVIIIKCYLINNGKYKLSQQGIINSDVQNTGNGINTQDVIAILKKTLKLIDTLPL